MLRFTVAVVALVASGLVSTAAAMPIEPRSLTWHIVSDREMSKICREHGQRPSCEGLAAWDKEFRMCIIWTRSPKGEDDAAGWKLIHHELEHCQEGHFHK